jgi:starch-binding outer membrane protein, SusD/RagB family
METMKSRILIFVMALFSIVVASCDKDLLEQKPKDKVAETAVFQDINLTQLFLNNIYGSLLSGFTRSDQGPGNEWSRAFSSLDCATDDCDGKHDAGIQQYLKNGITSASSNHVNEAWISGYALIRKTNLLIDNIDKVPGDAATLARMKAEARFLRAFSYFELAKFFGGVPLITTVQKFTDDLLVPRSTYQETIDFVVAECAAIVTDLPGPTDKSGKATSGAAKALKGKALLYLASPLNNPSNDLNKWKAAADALKDVTGYDLYPDYKNTFWVKNNIEVIWDRQYLAPTIVHDNSYKWEMTGTGNNGGGWGGLHPTEDLVSSYETTDGLAITDPASIYNPNDPYRNRDKRLAATILYNGATYKGKRIEIWDDGNGVPMQPTDGKQNIRNPGTDWPTCGYGLGPKIQDEKQINTALTYGVQQDNNFIYIRYADVLLMFAEARNEFSGPDAEVYSAINKVRARAGQPPIAALSQATMRDRIIKERRVELAFEEHRLFDLKRWKLAEVYLNKPTMGLRAVANNTSDPFGGGFVYTKFPVPGRQRVFDATKMYLFPIPQSEITKNSKLIQNPNW